MRRREFIWFLGGGLVCPCVALAQQRAKQTKIGWLSPFSSSIPAAAKNLQAFRQSLEHLVHSQA